MSKLIRKPDGFLDLVEDDEDDEENPIVRDRQPHHFSPYVMLRDGELSKDVKHAIAVTKEAMEGDRNLADDDEDKKRSRPLQMMMHEDNMDHLPTVHDGLGGFAGQRPGYCFVGNADDATLRNLADSAEAAENARQEMIDRVCSAWKEPPRSKRERNEREREANRQPPQNLADAEAERNAAYQQYLDRLRTGSVEPSRPRRRRRYRLRPFAA
jgi:hypothetical protein